VIRQNLKLNDIKENAKVIVTNQEANLLLLESSGFDYIDVDPFGTPNPFLDSAVKRISRSGVLAVTATDTSALSGTYPDACVRKYWAKPLKTEIMHEVGLRILIRKCQLVGAQFDKALIPVYSYSKDHYMRVFFLCEKGKGKVDEVMKEHGHFMDAGPMWLGRLWDSKLAEKMSKLYKDGDKELAKFLSVVKEESKIDSIGFCNVPALFGKKVGGTLPKQEVIISKIRKKGYKAAVTHIKENSIRTDMPEKELKKLFL
jgi:tRNA (guanine26-N2/guanine27-N2)-dimethyltransferase